MICENLKRNYVHKKLVLLLPLPNLYLWIPYLENVKGRLIVIEGPDAS
jgi:hypothetical protein